MIENPTEIGILILQHLKGKQMGEWTPEIAIEQALDGTVHYYHVRQVLPNIVAAKFADFSKMGCSYKITAEGRRYVNEHTQK